MPRIQVPVRRTYLSMRRLLLVTACDGQVGRDFGRPGPSWAPMMRPTRANKPNGYLLGSYRIATAPEPNSSRLTSLKSTRFDSLANKPTPAGASRLPLTVPYPTPA